MITLLEDAVMRMIGSEIAKMHRADVIHGDLTTSNMLLRRPNPPKGLQLVRHCPRVTTKSY